MKRPDGPPGLATPSTWGLGLAYAREGRVNVMHHDRVHHGITARCKGSHNRNYTVHVSYSLALDGELDSLNGSCSCPVAYNCKHCVAVVCAELGLAGPHRGRPPFSGHPGGRTQELLTRQQSAVSELNPDDAGSAANVLEIPQWRRTLDRIFVPVADQQRFDRQPLGLLFTFRPDTAPGEQSPERSRYASTAFGRRLTELGHSYPGRPGFVHVVPLRAGKRQQWVRSGISWMRLRTGDAHDADPGQLDALNELRRLYTDVESYIGTQDVMALERINHPALWSVLREVQDAGIALVEEGSYRPVTLEPDPAQAEIEIHQSDAGDLNVQATMRHPSLGENASSTKLGDPPHGLAWRDDAGVHLAKFEQPADRSWKQLAAEGDKVNIPAGDYEDFVQTVLPRISRVGWASPDKSFNPPPPPAPRLHLELGVASVDAGNSKAGNLKPKAHLHWGWHYRDEQGRGRGPLPLQGALRDPMRDTDEEGRIAGAVASEFSDIPAALARGISPHGRPGYVGGLGKQAPTPGRAELAIPDSAVLNTDTPAGSATTGPSDTLPPGLRQDADLVGFDVVKLVDDVLPRLEELGVVVETAELPDFQETTGARIQIGLSDEPSTNDWLDLNISVVVSGHELPISTLITSLTAGDEALFLPDGNYLKLDDPDLDRLKELLKEASELGDQRRDGVRVPKVRLSWWEELLSLGIVQTQANAWFQAVRRSIDNPPAPAELPAGLDAKLRPYQLDGFRWLAHLRRSGLGGVLADDMGLGKTVQALAMILDEREHPSLPEADDDRIPDETKVVDLAAYRAKGKSGGPGHETQADGHAWLSENPSASDDPLASSGTTVPAALRGSQVQTDVPVTSGSDESPSIESATAAASPNSPGSQPGHPRVSTEHDAVGWADEPHLAPWLVVAPTSVVPNWASEARKFAPDLDVVMIEATETRRGVPLSEIAAEADVVITSYALLRLEADDYAAEHWAGMIADEAQNAKNHASKVFAAVKGVGAPVTYAITGTPMENNLNELWAMFTLTAPGLLGSPKQFRESFQRPIEKQADEAGELMSVLRRRIAPFLLRRTKNQVALDLPPKQEQVISVELTPAHRRIYDRQLQRERQRVLQLTDDIEHNQIEVLAALTRLRQLAIDPSLVDQGDKESKAPSSKLDALVPLLQEAAGEGHRVLVFSQFTRYLRKIAARLDHEKLAYSYLDGTTPHRRQVIDGFTSGDDPVFLISLKAGGAGINLTQADYAILADPWWNPAVENQAVDRTHRIGQTKPVHVYRMVSKDTIEEKVVALQDAKRELISGVLGSDDDFKATRGRERGNRLTAEDVRLLLE